VNWSTTTPAIRLDQSHLDRLPAEVQAPLYDRNAVTPGIVHIGVGGFHRAHQAAYLDNLLHQPGHDGWGLCGVGLLKQDALMRDVMARQDCLYTLVTRGSGEDRARVIGSILRYLYAPDDPEAVIERMAAPQTRIVSLTITDRGYYVNHGTGDFDDRHPDILHDLADPRRPIGTFGYLSEALDRRRIRGLPPFTLMSCDNFQNNGDLTRRMLLAFLKLRTPGLHDWVDTHGVFPNSMVDRITPMTTDEHRALVRNRFGIEDGWPVTTEPFTQWVIEDKFVQGRPPWERVGVLMTDNVEHYEKMKIRLLNGSHQVLCYIGLLLGYRTAPEAMADAQVERLLQKFMDEEVTPLLYAVPGVDLEVYKRTLRERFANPAIDDQLARLATDGSSRIPEFVVPTILEHLLVEGPIKIASFTIAAWIRYLAGVDDRGRPLPISDPLADTLRQAAIRSGPDPREILSITKLFGEGLASHPSFVEEVAGALRGFYTEGARATLSRYTGD
jgi:mannitol 2-dehydrogenase